MMAAACRHFAYGHKSRQTPLVVSWVYELLQLDSSQQNWDPSLDEFHKRIYSAFALRLTLEQGNCTKSNMVDMLGLPGEEGCVTIEPHLLAPPFSQGFRLLGRERTQKTTHLWFIEFIIWAKLCFLRPDGRRQPEHVSAGR
jgi:hypothetical protein